MKPSLLRRFFSFSLSSSFLTAFHTFALLICFIQFPALYIHTQFFSALWCEFSSHLLFFHVMWAFGGRQKAKKKVFFEWKMRISYGTFEPSVMVWVGCWIFPGFSRSLSLFSCLGKKAIIKEAEALFVEENVWINWCLLE